MPVGRECAQGSTGWGSSHQQCRSTRQLWPSEAEECRERNRKWCRPPGLLGWISGTWWERKPLPAFHSTCVLLLPLERNISGISELEKWIYGRACWFPVLFGGRDVGVVSGLRSFFCFWLETTWHSWCQILCLGFQAQVCRVLSLLLVLQCWKKCVGQTGVSSAVLSCPPGWVGFQGFRFTQLASSMIAFKPSFHWAMWQVGESIQRIRGLLILILPAKHTHIYTHTYTYIHTPIYAHIHTCTHIHTHTCIHTCTCIYIHIDIYTHTFSFPVSPSHSPPPRLCLSPGQQRKMF